MVTSRNRHALHLAKSRLPIQVDQKRKRSKDGCITCRVRGKRCDCNRSVRDDGTESCDTCTRLRICCLGFHEKRPLWLKDKANEIALKSKIKEFLLSQGLIRGQPFCGLRHIDPTPRFLTLEEVTENDMFSSLPFDELETFSDDPEDSPLPCSDISDSPSLSMSEIMSPIVSPEYTSHIEVQPYYSHTELDFNIISMPEPMEPMGGSYHPNTLQFYYPMEPTIALEEQFYGYILPGGIQYH